MRPIGSVVAENKGPDASTDPLPQRAPEDEDEIIILHQLILADTAALMMEMKVEHLSLQPVSVGIFILDLEYASVTSNQSSESCFKQLFVSDVAVNLDVFSALKSLNSTQILLPACTLQKLLRTSPDMVSIIGLSEGSVKVLFIAVGAGLLAGISIAGLVLAGGPVLGAEDATDAYAAALKRTADGARMEASKLAALLARRPLPDGKRYHVFLSHRQVAFKCSECDFSRSLYHYVQVDARHLCHMLFERLREKVDHFIRTTKRSQELVL